MKRVPIIGLVFITALMLSACGRNQQKGILDLELIPVQTLFSGKVNTIKLQDLFFAEDYSTFKHLPHSGIKSDYDSLNQILTLTPNPANYGMTIYSFQFDGEIIDVPVQLVQKKVHKFAYKPENADDKVFLFGSFNAWNRQNLPLNDEDGDGVKEISLEFETGRYEYKFLVNGQELLDPSNPENMPNGLGGFNNILRIEAQFSGQQPHLSAKKLTDESSDRANLLLVVYLGEKNQLLLREHIIALYDYYRIPEKFIHVDEKGIKIGLSWRNFPKDGLHRLRIMAASPKFQSNMLELILKDGQSLPLKNQQTVWQDAIIYSIVTDRFADGDPENNRPVTHSQLADRANFYGGDFRGIINKFSEGYFAHLGVNTLWLSPFYKTTDKAFREYPEPHRFYTGYHGYWPVEPRTVEPRMGTEEELKELIRTAHSQNVKVLMDFVSNHIHEEHPYFMEHRDWFGVLDLPDGRKNLRLWDEQRLSTWFEPYLPSFDFISAPEAVEAVTEDAVWWMRNFNLDGFRHDAVKHVPNEFWRALTRRLKSEFPQKDIFQIGETFGDYELVKSYVNNGQLSSQFNFNLYWPARQAFVNPETGFAELASEMERTLSIYGQLHLMANIMDSHDQPRLAAYFDGDLDWAENTAEAGWERDIQVNRNDTYDKIALYMAWLMAIPGVPTIYYGDEVGMTGAGDPDNRRPMLWAADLSKRQKELRNQLANLIQLRNSHSALRYGDYYTMLADETVFAFLRSDLNERILIVIHRGESDRELSFDLPESLDFRRIEPILDNPQKLDVKGKQVTLSLKALTSYYLKII